ncbi:unnamed protein product [Closterium sp. NIES-64]|nr:unnamed protein product [Closterium sp. NIES-64]
MAAHQLNLQPGVSLPETSPTLRWKGKVGDASAFWVWGSRAFVRDMSADKLSPHAVPCDVTFDELVRYYRLFPYRIAPPPPRRRSSLRQALPGRPPPPSRSCPVRCVPGVSEPGGLLELVLLEVLLALLAVLEQTVLLELELLELLELELLRVLTLVVLWRCASEGDGVGAVGAGGTAALVLPLGVLVLSLLVLESPLFLFLLTQSLTLDLFQSYYPDAPDILTPRSYAEAIEGPYFSQWQLAMDAEMASWKSTGTYVDKVPPPEANIVSGMWILMVKRPPGSPPVFKATLPAQRDYELHSLDFTTAFL